MSKSALRYPESAIAGGVFGTARVRSEIASAAAHLESSEPVGISAPIAQLLGDVPPARSKYGNQQCVVDGITFDSKREAARYAVLALRQRAGEITNLRIQVPFVIAPAVTINGKSVRERLYIADFVYDMPHGLMVVEDSKGMQTPMYRLKRQLMKVIHNIDIQEV